MQVGAGSPLSGDVRAHMESAFDMDFSAVRVHQDDEAREHGALAFARGADLHFAPGRFDPSSASGRALLGHELAHVAQHAEGRAFGINAKGAGGDAALEAEADAMGERAARGERARPVGAPRLAASRDPSAGIQRMIDTNVPAHGTWDQVEQYLAKTIVNPRKQTFEQAVDEYLATQPTAGAAVNADWQQIAALRALRTVGQEAQALLLAQSIRTAINTAKSTTPDHPNKRGIQPSAERYETIPQSEASMQYATTLRGELIQLHNDCREIFDRRRSQGWKYKDPADNRYKWIDGHWALSFMLCVFIRPDGAVLVSHSGFMGTSHTAAFRAIVTRHGWTPVTPDDAQYSTIQTNYKADAQAELHGNPTQQIRSDHRHKEKVTDNHTRESGNPLGVCAAPQALDGARGIASDFPAAMSGNTPMAMTEIWVDASTHQVTVKDDAGTDQQYSGNVDVPSCLSCQFQLRAIMKRLVDLRRNVENREAVHGEERDAGRLQIIEEATKLRDMLADPKLATILTGVAPNAPYAPSAPIDLQKLTAEIVKYKAILDREAKERTQHPEHVQSGPTPAMQQNAKEAPQQHREAQLQRRIEVGKHVNLEAAKSTREVAAQGADKSAKESAEARDEIEQLQVRDEAAVLERVQGYLRRAFDYRVQGRIDDDADTVLQHLREALAAYTDLAARISYGDASFKVAKALDQAMQRLRSGDLAFEQALARCDAQTRERRANESLETATASSEQRTRDADSLYGLAMMLAQTYDTSIEHQVASLNGYAPQPPAQDHSDAYIG